MKTEISRNSNQPDKRYSGVYQQQGRMLTDADWNELTDLAKDRLNDVLRDVIGSGTPQARSIVSVETLADGRKEYKLQWGYAYVDGIKAQLMPREDATISAPPSLNEIYSNQADFPHAPLLTLSNYKLYLDVWERTVVSLEDKALSDPGLHGADTCTRTQTMVQLKWCDITESPSSFPTRGDALLTLQVRRGSTQPDLCDPCADKVPIQKKAGNYLFRVEIHDVGYNSTGNPERITLKWSSENGAEQFNKTNLPPGFASERWVYEFFSDEAEDFASEKHLGYHKHTDPAWSPTRYALKSGYPSVEPTAMVRRWDGYCTLVNNSGNWELASDGSALLGVDLGVALSNGGSDDDLGHISEGPTVIINLSSIILTIDLDSKQVLAGDYWIVPVREAVHKAGDVLLDLLEPCGIIHHYLPLASVSDRGVVTGLGSNECKSLEFPPLTDLHADDVCFDNTQCEMPSAKNVQEAIDTLCRERDIQWHNKHLHGWGVVCGLKVKCHTDRMKVVIEPGHALDCEGFRLQLDRRDESRIVDIVKIAKDEGLLDNDGNGHVSLWIDHDSEHLIRVNIEAHTPQDFWDSVLEGTLLKEFFDDCIFSLFTFALGQFPSSFEDKPPVTEPQRRLTTLINLFAQLINPASGQYVFLSSEEDRLLREFYKDLKLLIGSETFCAMFDGDRVFPDYTLDSGLDTVFGPPLHFSNRLRLNYSRNMAYTCGLGNKIYVYDLTSQNLIQTLTFPGGDNLVVQDVAISTDGKKMYAVALVDGKDSVFATANIDNDGIHTWGPTAVVCGKKFLTLATSPEFPESLYAICRGQGLYVFDPENISVALGGADVEFNSTGLMTLSTDGNQVFAAASSESSGTESSNIAHTISIDLTNLSSSPVKLFDITAKDWDVSSPAVDDITCHNDVIYMTGSKATNRCLFGCDISSTPLAIFEVGEVDLADQSFVRLAGLTFGNDKNYILAALADNCEVMRVDVSNQSAPSLDSGFRIPTQVMPIDIEVSGAGDQVYILNLFSNTLTVMDVATVFGTTAPNYTVEPPTVISTYRQGVLNAFEDLLGHLMQYLKDCFCDKFLIDCPDSTGDEKIYLGAVEIRGSEVDNICNFTKRHYVKSFPTWSYWMSTIPILPLLKKGFAMFCCSTSRDSA